MILHVEQKVWNKRNWSYRGMKFVRDRIFNEIVPVQNFEGRLNETVA